MVFKAHIIAPTHTQTHTYAHIIKFPFLPGQCQATLLQVPLYHLLHLVGNSNQPHKLLIVISLHKELFRHIIKRRTDDQL